MAFVRSIAFLSTISFLWWKKIIKTWYESFFISLAQTQLLLISLLKLHFFLQLLCSQIVEVWGQLEVRGVLRGSEDLRLAIQLGSDWLALLQQLQIHLYLLQSVRFLRRQHQVLLSPIWDMLFRDGDVWGLGVKEMTRLSLKYNGITFAVHRQRGAFKSQGLKILARSFNHTDLLLHEWNNKMWVNSLHKFSFLYPGWKRSYLKHLVANFDLPILFLSRILADVFDVPVIGFQLYILQTRRRKLI